MTIRLHHEAKPPDDLTKAQIEALRAIAQGDRHAAAAEKLGISESASRRGCKSARVRLEARTTSEAIQRRGSTGCSDRSSASQGCFQPDQAGEMYLCRPRRLSFAEHAQSWRAFRQHVRHGTRAFIVQNKWDLPEAGRDGVRPVRHARQPLGRRAPSRRGAGRHPADAHHRALRDLHLHDPRRAARASRNDPAEPAATARRRSTDHIWEIQPRLRVERGARRRIRLRVQAAADATRWCASARRTGRDHASRAHAREYWPRWLRRLRLRRPGMDAGRVSATSIGMDEPRLHR